MHHKNPEMHKTTCHSGTCEGCAGDVFKVIDDPQPEELMAMSREKLMEECQRLANIIADDMGTQDFEATIERLETELATIAEFRELEGNAHELAIELGELQEQRADANSKAYGEAKDERDMWHERYLSCERSRSQLKDSLCAAKKKIHEAEVKLLAMEENDETISDLHAQLRIAEQQAAMRLQRDRADVERFTYEGRPVDELIPELIGINDSLKDQVRDLNGTINTLQDELGDLMEAHSVLEGNLRNFTTAKVDPDVVLRLKTDVSRLVKEANTAHSENLKLAKNLDAALEDLGIARGGVHEANVEILRKGQEIGDLRKALSARPHPDVVPHLESEIDRMAKVIYQLNNTVALRGQEIGAWESKSKALSTERHQLESKNELKRNRIESLERQLAARPHFTVLESQLAQEKTAHAMLRAKLKALIEKAPF